MRRALLTTVLGAALWPAAAAADTVAHRTPAIGPKIAGPQTVWGEERDEGVRVMAGARDAAPRVLYRLPDSDARKTQRNFFHTPWSLSASPTHVAAIVHTGTITSEGSDFVGTTVTSAAVGGPLAAVRALSGRTPPRGDSACKGTSEAPEAAAVDGARIAIAELGYECEVPGSARPRIALHDGDAARIVPLETEVHVLQLAGRYLAWVQEAGRRQELVVHDLTTGAVVLRESRFVIGDIDLEADGSIAFTFADGPRDRGDFRSRMLLRGLDGGVRRLATFTPRRRRVGDLDLSPHRAVWAAQKTRSADYEAKPSGPARIVSRPL